MNDTLLITLITSGIVYGTPLLIAGLGELLTERSGVLNLGIEGMMLVGGVTAFWVSQKAGGPGWSAIPLALLAALAAGALMALVHAFVTITLQANQVVSGLALSILGGAAGLSSYLADAGDLGGRSGKHQLDGINLLGLKDLPVLGPVLFHQDLLVYGSWALVAAVAFYLRRTRPGLNLRAVGEAPRAADAMGVNVTAHRYAHTLAGGALAGLGGAYYALAITPTWTDGITAGAGWIALALVIFAFWRPVLVLVGAYLFGMVSSLGFNLQAHGVSLPPELFAALPYLTTILVLVLVSSVWAKRRLGAPAALGVPYVREDH
ncbi:ABC transporter permease [Streptomyces sp. A30]|uniref:ABC transporter permease n=1 Tax=Streptomyces sp. A30 TaxID=2789273 RepID=UPI00398031E7